VVNRLHRCPFCNQELKEFKSDVFKNYHFNTLKKIVEQEKKNETQKYFSKVFSSDQVSQIEAENQELELLLKPVERRIVECCSQALMEYRKFLVALYHLEKKSEEKRALHGLLGIRDHATLIKEISVYVLEKFPNPVVSPLIIEQPTQIHIVLPGNKVNKNVINLAPMATFGSLLPYIEKVCSENNVELRGKI
jgi:cytidine deaminase